LDYAYAKLRVYANYKNTLLKKLAINFKHYHNSFFTPVVQAVIGREDTTDL